MNVLKSMAVRYSYIIDEVMYYVQVVRDSLIVGGSSKIQTLCPLTQVLYSIHITQRVLATPTLIGT